MPSKTSKPPRSPSRSPQPASRPWKVASGCSEAEILAIARELAGELAPGHRVLLEGPMGAGKTTFSRELLGGLGVEQPPEGSPSFAIAHEYRGRAGEVIHMDLYRIKNESELVEAGIEAYFWERPQAVVLAEWTSLWPELAAAVERTSTGRVWRVGLDFSEGRPEDRRRIVIERA